MREIPAIMRGVWLTGHGDFGKLEVRDDIPVPQPARGEVLIRIAAAGVNNTDINTRVGWYSKHDGGSADAGWTGAPIGFPRIQGIDVCGYIVAVGAGVGEHRIGERVLVEPCLREVRGVAVDPPWFLGSECDGGFAEYTAVASRHAWRIESDFSDTELASFPCSYSTAENLLTRSQVVAQDRVLVTGASGGVGSAVVQLARARGAQVIAMTAASKSDQLRALGAERTVPRDADLLETVGRGNVDVVIDLVAGPQWPQFLDVLRAGGRYAVSGAIAGPMVQLDVRTLYLKDLSLFGCTVLGTEVFANLVDHIQQRRVSALVARTYPLHQIVEAQQAFLEKQHVGKIVLTIDTQD